jgi:7-alpha-hydroxysteroid dehydrogenase
VWWTSFVHDPDPAATTLERFRLTDRVAIVTGGGKGIGAAIAVAFAQAGADVAIAARTEADLHEVEARIVAAGRRALVYPADLTDLSVLPGLVERTVAELGRLDVLVNNAGGSVPQPFTSVRIDQFENGFHFDVIAAFELSRLAVPHLVEHPGASIINISSVIGRNNARATLVPGTVKAAQSQMTRLLAADLAPRIRVNAILPGAIETDALKGALDAMPAEIRRTMILRTPMRRNGTPEDIADAAVFLASPAASFITGKLLEVDGGAGSDLIAREVPDV